MTRIAPTAHDRADRRGEAPYPGERPLRVLPIPDTEPAPLPPEPPLPRTAVVQRAGRTVDRYVQETLAVRFRPAPGEDDFGPQPTASGDLPDAADWAGRIIRAILEAMDGSRPAAQLTRWLAPDIHERVARRGTLARQRRQPRRHASAVRRMLACSPADGVVEISAVVAHDGRVRALALRLSGVDGRWLVTALEVG